MDLKEKPHFHRIEEEINHWWIKTRFNYINDAVENFNSKKITFLEYGCGTCNNLYYILNRSPFISKIKSVTGIDPNLKNLQKPDWALNFDLHLDNSLSDKFQADIILAMDVLEHIRDDYYALKEWKKILKPNGIILISVPAFQHLWSHHDEFLGHYRRYNKKDLYNLARSVGLQDIKINYIFSYIYPAVFILRKCLPKILPGNSDLRKNNKFINSVLSFLGKTEYKLGIPNIFGTSVVGIFKNNVK